MEPVCCFTVVVGRERERKDWRSFLQHIHCSFLLNWTLHKFHVLHYALPWWPYFQSRSFFFSLTLTLKFGTWGSGMSWTLFRSDTSTHQLWKISLEYIAIQHSGTQNKVAVSKDDDLILKIRNPILYSHMTHQPITLHPYNKFEWNHSSIIKPFTGYVVIRTLFFQHVTLALHSETCLHLI